MDKGIEEIIEDPRMRHAATCAAELFLRDGIDSVKMTQIADAAGLGVATLYRRFSTKGRIAVAAATILWSGFNRSVIDVIESPEFLELNGADRLERLLRIYSERYVENPAFVAFLDSLDHAITAGQVDQEALESYGTEVDSFYLIFEDAYQMGRQDGSVAREVDFGVFYRSVAHALMGVAQKLSRGEVIPSDDFSNGAEELECIVDMAIRSLR